MIRVAGLNKNRGRRAFEIIIRPMPEKLMSTTRPRPIEVTSLVAITQAAVGCGVGLLLASRFQATARKVTGWIMVSLGVASVTPLLVGYFTRTANRPGSARAMRRRLDSIRQDSGFSENADVF